jgi:hypothetical protein
MIVWNQPAKGHSEDSYGWRQSHQMTLLYHLTKCPFINDVNIKEHARLEHAKHGKKRETNRLQVCIYLFNFNCIYCDCYRMKYHQEVTLLHFLRVLVWGYEWQMISCHFSPLIFLRHHLLTWLWLHGP